MRGNELHRLKYALSSGNLSFIAHWLERYENLLLDDESHLEETDGQLDSSVSTDFWLSVSSSVIASVGKLAKGKENVEDQMTCADSEDESTNADQGDHNKSICHGLEILAKILLLCFKSTYPQSKLLLRDIVEIIRGSDIQLDLVAMISTCTYPLVKALILAVLSASMDLASRQQLLTHDVLLNAAGIAAVLISGNQLCVFCLLPVSKHMIVVQDEMTARQPRSF